MTKLHRDWTKDLTNHSFTKMLDWLIQIEAWPNLDRLLDDEKVILVDILVKFKSINLKFAKDLIED